MKNKGSVLNFDKSIRVLNFLLSFCFFYCLLLFLYFNQYQFNEEKVRNGECAFQPFVYFSTIISFYLLYYVFRRFKNFIAILVLDLFIIVLSVAIYPINNQRYLLAAVMIMYIAVDVVMYGILENRNNSNMEIWFTVNSIWWGIGILILMIVSYFISEHQSKLSVSYMDCSLIMAVVSMGYLVLYIVQKYSMLFYKHYKSKRYLNYIQVMQKRKVVFIVSLITVTAACMILILSGIATIALEEYFAIFAEALSALFSLIATPLMETEFAKLFMSKKTEIEYIESNRKPSEIMDIKIKETGQGAFSMFFLGLLILTLIIMVYRMYKSVSKKTISYDGLDEEIIVQKAATYEIVNKTDKLHVSYGNTNNEKIRKNYYKLIKYLSKKKALISTEKMTSGDIKTAISNNKVKSQYAKELTQLYDKARYSDANMKNDAVKKAKYLCGRIKEGKE